MTDVFSEENRVKLYYAIADYLPAYEERNKVASLPVLDELLRKKYGRFQLARGDDVDEIIKNFIREAPEEELLDLIEFTPIAHYVAMKKHFSRSNPGMESLAERQSLELEKELNRVLEKVLHHPARFVFKPHAFVRDGLALQETTHFSKLPKLEQLQADLARLLAARELVSVLYIDLDHFSDVNNTLGHDAGNECLDAIVHIISNAILKKGVLYRYGGDEFVVVLRNFTSAEAGATAERIRAAIDEGNPGRTVKVTTSIGVVSSTKRHAADELIKTADAAMYVSKKQRNCVTIA